MQYNSIIIDDELTARKILRRYIAEIDFLNLIGECKNAIEASEVLSLHNVDIIFLDIEMPKLSGFDFLKVLRNPPNIVITTAYREYALDSYDFNVIDYLLKPISFERFLKAVNKIIDPKIPENSKPDAKYAYFKSGKRNIQVYFNEILYIQGMSNYVKIVTRKGSIVVYEKLSDLEMKLPRNNFVRIHRSYIAAINNIKVFGSDYLEIDKYQLSISDSYKAQFFSKISELKL